MSKKEFALLRALAADPTRVFTREELLRGVWGYRSLAQTRTLDSHAGRLRKKLAVGGERFVVNVWGVGYRLVNGGASDDRDGRARGLVCRERRRRRSAGDGADARDQAPGDRSCMP